MSIRHWQCISSFVFSTFFSHPLALCLSALTFGIYLLHDMNCFRVLCVLVSIRLSFDFFFPVFNFACQQHALAISLIKMHLWFRLNWTQLIKNLFSFIANFFCVASFEFRFERNKFGDGKRSLPEPRKRGEESERGTNVQGSFRRDAINLITLAFRLPTNACPVLIIFFFLFGFLLFSLFSCSVCKPLQWTIHFFFASLRVFFFSFEKRLRRTE